MKIKCFISLLFIYAFMRNGAAQNPANDPNWQLNTAASDEFNSPTYSNLWSWGTNTGTTSAMKGYYLGILNDVNNTILDPSYPTGSNQTGAVRFKFTAKSTYAAPLPTPAPCIIPPATQTQMCWGGYESDGKWWAEYNSSTVPPGPDWRGGGLSSLNNYPYTYGYYEFRLKMPGYPSAANPSVNTQLGLLPLVWMSKSCWCSPTPEYLCPQANFYMHDEIDQIEGDGYSNRNFEVNGHMWYDVSQCPEEMKVHSPDYIFEPEGIDVVNQWHTYGMEVTPSYIKFYFDDNLYGTCTDPLQIPTNTMTVWLHLAYSNPLQLATNTPYTWPQSLIESTAPIQQNPVSSSMEMVADYFRYYTLNTSQCLVDYLIINPNDLSGFPNQVRHDVFVGQTGLEVILMNNNSSKTIRHSGSFEVICDFEVPLGSELTVLPTSCH